jgi:ribosomal protein S8E
MSSFFETSNGKIEKEKKKNGREKEEERRKKKKCECVLWVSTSIECPRRRFFSASEMSAADISVERKISELNL